MKNPIGGRTLIGLGSLSMRSDFPTLYALSAVCQETFYAT